MSCSFDLEVSAVSWVVEVFRPVEVFLIPDLIMDEQLMMVLLSELRGQLKFEIQLH